MTEKDPINSRLPQQKKVWQKPEFYILDTDSVHATKNFPKIHEGTAVLSDGSPPTHPANYYSNAAKTVFYIKSHKSQFLS